MRTFQPSSAIRRVVDKNAEIAVPGPVVLAFTPGEIPEDNAGVFDDEIIKFFACHSYTLSFLLN